MRSLPDVAAVRPARCPRCHVASRPPGRPLAIHGHGVVTRHLWGPPDPGRPPEFGELRLRRYRCLECDAVIRVGPRGVFGRRRYSAAAIGLALALWALCGRAPEDVREAVSPWRNVAIETKRRWPSLMRWTRAARRQQLWPIIRGVSAEIEPREAAAMIITALVAALPDSTLGSVSAAQVFAAAQHQGGPA